MIFMQIYSSRHRTTTTKLKSNGEEWKNVSRCGKIGDDELYVKEDHDKKIISFGSKKLFKLFFA